MENQLIISKFADHCSTLIICNCNIAAAMCILGKTHMERRFSMSPGRLDGFVMVCFFFNPVCGTLAALSTLAVSLNPGVLNEETLA